MRLIVAIFACVLFASCQTTAQIQAASIRKNATATVQEGMLCLNKIAANPAYQGIAKQTPRLGNPSFEQLAAEGVITDSSIGDQWITTNISPYRSFILEEWSNWLNRKNDIQRFFYPPPGVTEGHEKWFIRAEGKDFLKRKMKVTPDKKDMRFVYIGSGIWVKLIMRFFI